MRASSSERSLSLARPRSDPRAAASSAAIIQSGQAKPGAESLGPRRLTRPSMLVVVPARSCVTAHGSTTSACASTDSDGWPVTATTKCPAPQRLLGHGAVGEVVERVGAEQHQRAHAASAAPSAAPASSPAMEARMSAVSRPAAGRHRAPGGGEALAARIEARPGPGRMPGARPMSSAPKTLPRRSAGRKVALGSAAASARTASAATSPDSA